MIYNKTLRINSATNKEFSKGEIINFVQTDSYNVGALFWYLIPFLRLPIYTVFLLGFLFYFFGVYLVVSITITIAISSINMIFVNWQANVQDEVLT